MPPETFDEVSRPYINHKVDIWSLGVILYEMVFGAKPFGNELSQEKILNDKIILKA